MALFSNLQQDSDFAEDLGATPTQIADIITAFEDNSGVDIPDLKKVDVVSIDTFVMGAMQVLLVENFQSYNLGLDGFGEMTGNGASDFGVQDSIITKLGFSIPDAMAAFSLVSGPFDSEFAGRYRL